MNSGTIKQSELKTYAIWQPIPEAAENIKQARLRKRKTVFLSHSQMDRDLAKGLQNRLRNQDVDLYIDWEDTSMPETPNRETAAIIQERIHTCDILLFLATQNSLQSRWCSWELGYADGKKSHDSIVVVPTLDDEGHYYGNEYIQLYNRLILTSELEKYGVFAPAAERGALFESFARRIR